MTKAKITKAQDYNQRDAFVQIDLNGDGFLTREEHTRWNADRVSLTGVPQEAKGDV
jgi:hypothetical protein